MVRKYFAASENSLGENWFNILNLLAKSWNNLKVFWWTQVGSWHFLLCHNTRLSLNSGILIGPTPIISIKTTFKAEQIWLCWENLCCCWQNWLFSLSPQNCNNEALPSSTREIVANVNISANFLQCYKKIITNELREALQMMCNIFAGWKCWFERWVRVLSSDCWWCPVEIDGWHSDHHHFKCSQQSFDPL